MVRLNRFIIASAIIVPTLISVLAVCFRSGILVAVCALAIIIEVAFLPQFDGSENLWMFLIVSVAGLPANIGAVVWLMFTDIFSVGDLPAMNLILGVVEFFIIFSIEQIAFGIVARFIRPVQKKIML